MVNLDATTPQLKVVKRITDAISSRAPSTAESVISKDYIFKTFPKSDELPDLTKEEYLQMYGAALALFANVEVTFHEIIETPGKVVTRFSVLFTTVDGTTLDYDSVMISSFVEEDGETKVIEAKDFSDPEKRGASYAEVAKALAKGGMVA